MRIVIDLQGAQSPNSAHRGLGRYALSMAQALVRLRAEHEVLVVFNGLFPDTIEPLRAAFDGLLPQENIRVWQAVGPVAQCEPAHQWRRKTAELIRESFIANLQPDVVYVSSLFEGWQDDAVVNIGLSASAIPTVIALYDFVSAEERATQAGNPSFQTWYNNKLYQLQHADCCMAISAGAYAAGIAQLGLPKNKLVEVGVAEHPQPKLPLFQLDGAQTFEYCPNADETGFWDETASKAWATFVLLHAARPTNVTLLPTRRPKLAYVSPLPPERSGIADYSAEILPELARYYDIDVISQQAVVSDSWVAENCNLHDANWLLTHADDYDRVMYHLGNSPANQHIWSLLAQVPGVVVLHDFYLSGLLAYLDLSGAQPGEWAAQLYSSHGYMSVKESFANRGNHSDNARVVGQYPCNFKVAQHALGVVVHSNYSKQLAENYYGNTVAHAWSVVPLPRTSGASGSKDAARNLLALGADDFVVCSFGMLGENKSNRRLLDAWLASPLAQDTRCHLVFVGENDPGKYGADLLATIQTSGAAERIKITGWTDTEQYRAYLAAADAGVQLRSASRGETSAAVLDCMNYGLPTIVNANGAMAELARDAVLMLEDEFSDEQLVAALTTLWQQPAQRTQLGAAARALLRTRHAPAHCAELYVTAIEDYYRAAEYDAHHLVEKISRLSNPPQEEVLLQSLAKRIAQNLPKPNSARQLFVDVSAIMQNDLKTGIQRVVRALLIELIKSPPAGYRIEPVYLTDKDGYWHYLYARNYALSLMGLSGEFMAGLGTPETRFPDEHIEVQVGDIMAVLDLTSGMVGAAEHCGLIGELKAQGVAFWYVVYDLLPILLPKVFPLVAETTHKEWLHSVLRVADGVLCISRAVADELTTWQKEFGPARLRPLEITSFHLGADVAGSVPSVGMPDDAASVLAKMAERPTFLMVGTVEPRKGQAQALRSFDLLWKQGVDVNLVIVGKQGWMMESLIDDIKAHEELDMRLFWMAGISDEYLEKLYSAASCLIAASEGEGFGLPLIEAAHYQAPLLVRDIPVFREVAGEHASYFSGLQDADLATAVTDWLKLNASGNAPQSTSMPSLTWQQSAQQLLDAMLHRTAAQPSSATLVVEPVITAPESAIEVRVIEAFVSKEAVIEEPVIEEAGTQQQQTYDEPVTQQQETPSAELKHAVPANHSTSYKGQAGKSKRNKSR